ncbi:hypothetical protein GGG16DRAFT_104911 [Schizophyllum commune]
MTQPESPGVMPIEQPEQRPLAQLPARAQNQTDGPAPTPEELHRRLQEEQNGATEEGEIVEGPQNQNQPPEDRSRSTTPRPGEMPQAESPAPPEDMIVDAVAATDDPSRLRLMRLNKPTVYHYPMGDFDRFFSSKPGVEEEDMPDPQGAFDLTSVAAPPDGGWPAWGVQKSLDELIGHSNPTYFAMVKADPKKFLILFVFFVTPALRAEDTKDDIPKVVRAAFARIYPAFETINFLWAGTVQQMRSNRVMHNTVVAPHVIIVPKRDTLPPALVTYLLAERHIVSDKVAVTVIDPDATEASPYYASFVCSIPGDSVDVQSRVLSMIIAAATDQEKVLKSLARAFTLSLPKRSDRERIEEITRTWNVHHMRMGWDDVWQLTGKPFIKAGESGTVYKSRKDLNTMFMNVAWENYALAFDVLLRPIPLAQAPVACDGCGDTFHPSGSCVFPTIDGYIGPKSFNAVRNLIPGTRNEFNQGGRGGFGFRGRGGGFQGQGFRGRGGFSQSAQGA